MQSYNVTYTCHFDHDGDTGQCTAKLIYCSKEMMVIRFHSSFSTSNEPTMYAINSYCGKTWIVNLSEQTSVFLSNILDVKATTDDLVELDDMDDYEAAELAEVIRLVSFEAAPSGPPDDEPSPQIVDDDLPF